MCGPPSAGACSSAASARAPGSSRVSPIGWRRIFAHAAVAALSLARKAGSAVSGFTKVEAALGKGSVAALIHCAEARADGIAKIAAAAWRHRGSRADGPPVVRLFTGEELDLAFGRTNVIHAALLAGPASTNVLKRVRAFADFVGGDMTVGDPDRAMVEQDKMSAGS